MAIRPAKLIIKLDLDLTFPTGLIPRVFILLNGWICLHGVLDKAGSKSVFERTLNHCTFHFIS